MTYKEVRETKYVFERLKYYDNKLIIKTKKKYLKTTDIKLLEKLIYNMFYNLTDVLYIEVEVNGNKRDVKTTIKDKELKEYVINVLQLIENYCCIKYAEFCVNNEFEGGNKKWKKIK